MSLPVICNMVITAIPRKKLFSTNLRVFEKNAIFLWNFTHYRLLLLRSVASIHFDKVQPKNWFQNLSAASLFDFIGIRMSAITCAEVIGSKKVSVWNVWNWRFNMIEMRNVEKIEQHRQNRVFFVFLISRLCNEPLKIIRRNYQIIEAQILIFHLIPSAKL